MEYGYEIMDTAGNKTFFVEGCTCCSMSTGGQHESRCHLKVCEGYREMGDGNAKFAEEYFPIALETWPKW